MSVLSSLFQLVTSLPHSLFLTCLSFFLLPLSLSLGFPPVCMMSSWPTNKHWPRSSAGKEDTEQRAEQQGCYMTVRTIPLQRPLTVPLQLHYFSQDDLKNVRGIWTKRPAKKPASNLKYASS